MGGNDKHVVAEIAKEVATLFALLAEEDQDVDTRIQRLENALPMATEALNLYASVKDADGEQSTRMLIEDITNAQHILAMNPTMRAKRDDLRVVETFAAAI